MDNQQRCQSCGMPLSEGFFGTMQGGKETTEYCNFCFQQGSFTEPELTVDAMLSCSIEHMKKELQFDEAKATQMANDVIPHLRRWNKKNNE